MDRMAKENPKTVQGILGHSVFRALPARGSVLGGRNKRFMLHWLCEAPASISIVVTTPSIPTELLIPAQN
jgi:hypothetical protein